MWIFICAELTVFAVFFAAYAFTRANHLELFNQYQSTLNTEFALLNTIALITSSYFVVRAIFAIKQDNQRICAYWLKLAILMGAIFLCIKSFEYYNYYAHGLNLRTNLFYMFYFSLTFFHFMHVIMGMVILFFVFIEYQ